MLNESKILYVESNKKVADAWLSLNRLQLPLGVKYGYNTNISQNDTDVNSSIRTKGENNTKFSLPETDRYVENINDIYGYKIKKEIYKKISDPIAIIAAKSESKSDEQRFISHRVIVLVDLSVDGHQVIAPIIVDAQSNINGKRIDTNILATYFDKGNISNMLSEAVALENDNKVGFYYLDKIRAQSLLMQ